MAARFLALLAVPFLLLSTGPRIENGALRRLVERGRHPAIRWGRFTDVQPDMLVLYGENGWNPLWLSNGRPTREAGSLIDVLATAASRGLDPEDYDAPQLGALRATLDRGGADQEQAIRFDVALSIAALRFTAALARGRISWKESGVLSDLGPPSYDGVALLRSLRTTSNPDSVISALEPPWLPYAELRRALGTYRRFATDSAHRRPFFQGGIRRIELALERWRWLPRRPADRAVFLSAPAGRLEFIEPEASPVWLLATLVSDQCRQAPAFSGQAWMMAFRPRENIAAAVKFPVTGDFPVYDAAPPAPNAGLASCVQVQNGEVLAQLILRQRPEWPPARIASTIGGTRQVFVRLKRPVAVMYVYSTAFPGADGEVIVFPDAYGQDRTLDRLLRRGYPYPN